MQVGIDNIVAAVLLSIIMLRRLELLGVSLEDNPQVSEKEFQHWKSRSLRVHNLAAIGCFAKVTVSISWFYLASAVFGPGQLALALIIGGASVFAIWVAMMVWCWREATEVRAIRTALEITGRRKKRE